MPACRRLPCQTLHGRLREGNALKKIASGGVSVSLAERDGLAAGKVDHRHCARRLCHFSCSVSCHHAGGKGVPSTTSPAIMWQAMSHDTKKRCQNCCRPPDAAIMQNDGEQAKRALPQTIPFAHAPIATQPSQTTNLGHLTTLVVAARDPPSGRWAGLEFLHKRLIIHRDLKPANSLLHGNDQDLKIADSGASAMIERSGTFGGSQSVGPRTHHAAGAWHVWMQRVWQNQGCPG